MKLDIYDQNGKKTGSAVEVSDAVFGAEVNENLLSQYVYIYLSNQRASIAHTKDRGDVSGGGKKPWRQKGTGRARAGSSRSPIWKGGGIAFGPTNDRNWKKTLNRKMRVGAMRSAWSMLSGAGKLKVIDDLKLEPTRLAKQAEGVRAAFGSPKKMTIVTDIKSQQVMNAFNNLPGVSVRQIGEVNPYDLMTGGEVLLMEKALEYTENWK